MVRIFFWLLKMIAKGLQIMNERIIITGKLKDIKKFCLGVAMAGFVIPVLYFFWDVIQGTVKSDGALPFVWLIVPVFVLIAILLYKGWSKIELTVSDKRVYGCAAFGKRVDLPLDAISAVGTSAFNGIAITTASGAIKFSMMENCNEIHGAVSQLLVDRQSKTTAMPAIKQEIPQSSADELKKYKDLLDGGVISQEEFDTKKKQLLGL